METIHRIEQGFEPSEQVETKTAAGVLGKLLMQELGTLWDPTISAEKRQETYSRYELARESMVLIVDNEKKTNIDHLTGLYNKASFQNQFDELLDFTWRNNARFGLSNGLSLFFLDLNKFKPINDELGHDAGDEILVEVGSRLSGSVRKYDKVHRFGGDEFVLVISGLPQDRLDDKCNEVKQIVSEPILLSTSDERSVGVAIGYVHFDSEDLYLMASMSAEDRNHYIAERRREADKKMYQDKENSGEGR